MRNNNHINSLKLIQTFLFYLYSLFSPFTMSQLFNEPLIREHYRELTKFLITNKMTITTMESATSGQIASLITDMEWASVIFPGAFVTYCNEAKIMQGVDPDILEKYSVYSEETAKEMAKACANAYHTNIGIGITGTMGNIDPNNLQASVPGNVFFAFWIDGNITGYHKEIPHQESRLKYKLAVAEEIYEKLRALIGNE